MFINANVFQSQVQSVQKASEILKEVETYFMIIFTDRHVVSNDLQWCAIETRHLIKKKDIFLILSSSQIISGTNDNSFESPYIGRLESAKQLVLASS